MLIHPPLDRTPHANVSGEPPAKLLIVDDSPITLNVLQHGLCEFRLQTARSGDEAFQRIDAARPDLILLDIMMPGTSGLEVCRRLKAQAATRDIPVIFMSALSDAEDKLSGFEAGAVDYVTKPVQWAELRARVDLHLRLAGLQRGLSSANAELRREVCARKLAEDRLQNSLALLKEVSAHRIQSHEAEYGRISRQLHEDIAQTLSALSMDISTLPYRYGLGLRDSTQRMRGLLDSTIRDIRDIVTALRPAVLDTNLSVGLAWLTQQFIRRTGIDCTLDLPAEDVKLCDRDVTTLFRIAQESLANVARHSGATQAKVSLRRRKRCWQLTIGDNGRGFDTEGMPAAKSFGIHAVKEMAALSGGECAIASTAGRGTTVRARLPLRAALQ